MSDATAPRTNWLGQPIKEKAAPSDPGNRKPKTDIASRRNRWYNRVWRFFRAIWLWALIIGIATWCYFDADVLNMALVALQFGAQILFAIFFMIIQFGALFWFMSRSRTEIILPGDAKSLTLTDYKGQKQLVKLVKEWISLLSDRSEFQKMGGNFINGLLLYGPPGTGKTMLAKCMAGEAGIAFMSTEGSSFRAMFIGVDVMKMMFFCSRAKKLAKEYGACIAYIDEIDAVGQSRSGVMGGGMGMGMMGGMGSGSLTRLLYEMDGVGEQSRMEKLQGRIYKFFGKELPKRPWHVLYMGSTNRPDVLDPALTRPGRFDRSIEVAVPDKTGRREIIQYYLGKVVHDETVDVEAIVSDTNGATPARLMSALTKDSVRIALFAGYKKVSQRHIDLAFQEQYFGIENPIEEMEEDQKRVLAYHEAGHAIVAFYVIPDRRIVRVSIIRRGDAYGYVLPVETKEWHIIPLRRYIANIMVSFAGRAAEKVFFGEMFNSVGGDFSSIRYNLRILINAGMFGPPPLDTSPSMMLLPGAGPSANHPEAERYWKMLESQVEQLLQDHAAEVHALANALLERNDLSGKEALEIIEAARAEAIARGETVPEGLPPMMMQLLPEHQRLPANVKELEPAPAVFGASSDSGSGTHPAKTEEEQKPAG